MAQTYSTADKRLSNRGLPLVNPHNSRKSLKINDPMLCDWVRTLGAESAEVFRGQGKRTAVQAEMTRMRRGIAVFRQPRDNQKSCGIPGKGVFVRNGFIKGHRCIGPLQVLCRAIAGVGLRLPVLAQQTNHR